MSLAGEAAAEARLKSALGPQHYTIRIGPSTWTFGAGLDLEANDNITFSSSSPQFDLIARPQLSARMAWRVSDANSMNLGLGAGYSAYAGHPEFNRLFVEPGSELSFDLYAGDFWIDLHERLSVTENAYEDPTVIGTADYSQLQSVTGASATWDLNEVVLRMGYDHAIYLTLSGGGIPEGDSDVLAFSTGYRWRPTSLIGLEAGGGRIGYGGDHTSVPQAWDWNVGTFWEAQPLQYISVKAAAGYTVYSRERQGSQPAEPGFTGVYARLGLNHRVNKHVEYSLEAARNISFGFFSGTVDMLTAILEARWHLFEKLSIGTAFQFDHGTDLAVGGETFDRFGPRLSLERPLTARMSGSLRYQYYQRQSNVVGGDYEINLVTLSIAYRL
jgi:hypothetical protein